MALYRVIYLPGANRADQATAAELILQRAKLDKIAYYGDTDDQPGLALSAMEV